MINEQIDTAGKRHGNGEKTVRSEQNGHYKKGHCMSK